MIIYLLILKPNNILINYELMKAILFLTGKRLNVNLAIQVDIAATREGILIIAASHWVS